MLQDLLLNTGYVLLESANSLATQISKYFSWNYRFPPESKSFKRPPMIVIVVDVYSEGQHLSMRFLKTQLLRSKIKTDGGSSGNLGSTSFKNENQEERLKFQR
ncbi:hypothetical protein WN944_002988 [Citrus x changshan-huyou]|uniref:Uncharacterized protein n=1 Tax=Citrus x changshan-huyou TaxID=2935761 RepID=A0AAP0MMD3_9ROSI